MGPGPKRPGGSWLPGSHRISFFQKNTIMQDDSVITSAEEDRYAELQRMALEAARKGDPALLAPMLEAGMPVNLTDEKGNSLLMLASYHGHGGLTEMLLARGALPDQRNDRNQTPLAGVAFKGHLEIARLLVKHGADPVADQGGGRYPVQFAAMFGHPELVAFFNSLEAGKKPSLLLAILATLTGWIRRLVGLLRNGHWNPPAVP